MDNTGTTRKDTITYEQALQEKFQEYTQHLVKHVANISNIELEIELTESKLVSLKGKLRNMLEDKERVLAALGLINEVETEVNKKE